MEHASTSISPEGLRIAPKPHNPSSAWPRGDFRTPEVRVAWVEAMADLAVPLRRGAVRGE